LIEGNGANKGEQMLGIELSGEQALMFEEVLRDSKKRWQNFEKCVFSRIAVDVICFKQPSANAYRIGPILVYEGDIKQSVWDAIRLDISSY
jgi:hypothetical protein